MIIKGGRLVERHGRDISVLAFYDSAEKVMVSVVTLKSWKGGVPSVWFAKDVVLRKLVCGRSE